KRRGGISKPIVVRPEGQAFEIIDGEHCWEAAKVLGFKDVPCEVVVIDEFEAMRQTYKRNCHGTADPVLLGCLFVLMMESKNLSMRKLAKEMNVTEGTIRNYLDFEKAARVRNGYVSGQGDEQVAGLTVKQVRQYLELPEKERDKWLDDVISGAGNGTPKG